MKINWDLKSINVRHILKHSPLVAILMALMVTSVSLILLSLPVDFGVSGISNPVEGQRAPDTVHALIDFDAVDQEMTLQNKKEAEQNLPIYFQCMNDASNQMAVTLHLFCDEAVRRGNAEKSKKEYKILNPGDPVQNQVAAIPNAPFQLLYRALENENNRKELLRKIEDNVINDGILPQGHRNNLKRNQKIVVLNNNLESNGQMLKDIPDEEAAAGETVELLLRTIHEGGKTETAEGLKQQFIPFFQHGNLQQNSAQTQQRWKNALKKVKPQTKRYRTGEIIVKKNKILNAGDIQTLSDYNKALKRDSAERKTTREILEKMALCIVLIVFSCIYAFAMHSGYGRDNRRIWMIGGIIIISMLLDYFSIIGFRKLCEIDFLMPQLVFMAIPFALPAILISILYGFRYAIFTSVYVSGIAALGLNNSFPVFVTGLLVCAICGVTARNVSDYKSAFLIPLRYSFLATFIAGVLFMIHTLNPEIIGKNIADICMRCSILAMETAVVTSILTVVALLLLETVFDLSTELFFVNYINRNHPLLKEFQMNAPGSYHHCERVASIAENAAGIIGATPAMVQACALFHDVGKMFQPGMFTENSDGTNPHSKLTPKESAAVIRQHVIYGLELAKKYKLKRRICDAIREHHGTDFISFFYMQAKKEDPNTKEEDFRYAGPAPQSKLTALLMLADCAEAISMSMSHPTREELDAKLKACFLRKIENGQLDEAPITASEISQIRESLVTSLVAMGHVRISYPPMASKETK